MTEKLTLGEWDACDGFTPPRKTHKELVEAGKRPRLRYLPMRVSGRGAGPKTRSSLARGAPSARFC
jgi:hypothetical protein